MNMNANQKQMPTNQRLQELIAMARAKAAAPSFQPPVPIQAPSLQTSVPSTSGIQLNQKQQEAMKTAMALTNSFCLIGAAGTGKTTAVREICKQLARNPAIPLLASSSKVLVEATPGIIVASFTNIAVQNIARSMEGIVPCTTIHNLTEFAPIYLEEINPATGAVVTKRIFEPNRNAANPLPTGIRVIIIEESGVVGTRLFRTLLEALPEPEKVTFIFLGDLHQLPPVFDNPILGHKLLELPVIELTEVYRQALDSPILALAHLVKDGKQQSIEQVKELAKEKELVSSSKLTIKAWQQKTNAEQALHVFQATYQKMLEAGSYNPSNTMILIPFNVNFGTVEANKIISHLLDKQQEREIFEVIAGFNKHYFAVGDIIYSRKRKAVITGITKNGRYLGKPTHKSSKTLDRWGIDSSISLDTSEEDAFTNLQNVESILEQLQSEDESRTTAASHVLEITLLDHLGEKTEQIDTLDAAAEINELIGGYCLTVHKAQGSEWENVHLWLHNSHGRYIYRELLYTGITRARENLTIICEKDTFIKGVNNQALKGNTLQEKLETLRQKLKEAETKKF